MTEQSQEPTPALSQEPEQVSGPGALPEPAGPEAPASASIAAEAPWPALPSELASADPSGKLAAVQDPAVSAVLDRLGAVPHTPVSGHGELYAGMHDALLEALNEDVTAPAGVARRIYAAGDGGS